MLLLIPGAGFDLKTWLGFLLVAWLLARVELDRARQAGVFLLLSRGAGCENQRPARCEPIRKTPYGQSLKQNSELFFCFVPSILLRIGVD
jgi:hypothetical protein